jgi:hypothetical protein
MIAKAMRVTHDNRAEVANECGGQTWADGVIVPSVDGEKHATVGDWVVMVPSGAVAVTDDYSQVREWMAQQVLPAGTVHSRVFNYEGRGGPDQPFSIRRTCTCGWRTPWIEGFWGDKEAVKVVDLLWRKHAREAKERQGG